MSVLIQLQSGTKSFGARVLFAGGQFAINETEHVGVIGPNGAGKSTLLKILAGTQELDSGEVIRAQRLRLAYLAQEDSFAPSETLTDFLTHSAVIPLWELRKVGLGLGLSEDLWERPICELSGGYRMRCKLLSLIGQDPNLLLLDEPTNYLDLESLLVLENFLLDYEGAFLLISHDREFLRRTTDHILEIEAGEFTKYNGNIDDYFEQKALVREQYEKQRLSQEAKRKTILDFAARFGAKATKARQAQSRLKQLERMPTLDVKALPTRARITIPEPERVSKIVIQVRSANLGYGDEAVLENLNLEFPRGAHVGVVGVNGAGKSTLLKALAGQMQPISGTIEYGQKVHLGYYAQHVAEALLADQTVFESLASAAHPEIIPQEIKDLAGSLLFSADDINKPIRILSGGEKSRVALGQILLQKCSCLLLDEPTNHLDFDTVEALTQALQRFQGTLVVVSHDRSFLQRIANRVLEIRDRQAQVYPGTYEEYVWSLQKGMWGERALVSSVPAIDVAMSATREIKSRENYKELRKSLERQIRQQQKQCAEATDSMQRITGLIASETAALAKASGLEAQELGRQIYGLQQELSRFEEIWLESSQCLEDLQKELDQLVGGGRSS